jgi:AraC family transcriptional regulator
MHSETLDDSEVSSFIIEIERSSFERVREYSDILDRPSHFQGGVPAMMAMKLYREFRCMDTVSPLAIEGLFLEMLAAVVRRETANSPRTLRTWLKQAEDLLRAHFGESISLREIAQQVGIHPVHLAREFRRRFGVTVGEYVRSLRIDRARRLIEIETPLKDVALSAGFFDQSHFCRVFRGFTGMTPSEYRSLRSRSSISKTNILTPRRSRS